jgi:hypothetical protein
LKPLARILPHLQEGEDQLARLAAAAGLSPTTTRQALAPLLVGGVAHLQGDTLHLSPGGRVLAAALAVKHGVALEAAAAALSWQEFEAFTARVLEAHAFQVHRHLVLGEPRMEIDLLATRFQLALALDCKQWRRQPPSRLREAAHLQAERARRLAGSPKLPRGVGLLVPGLVTLYQPSLKLVAGIPVIPITLLNGFLAEFEGHLPELRAFRPGQGGVRGR